jgi:membrane-associated phospholipid phosphatase
MQPNTRSPRRAHPAAVAAFAASLLITGCGGTSLLGIEAPDREYWGGYCADTVHVVTRPASWTGRGWLAAGGFVAGVLVLQAQDEAVRREVQDARDEWVDDIAVWGEHLGSVEVLLPVLAVGYGIGYAADDGKLKEASLLGFESVVISGIVGQGIKHLFGRARPYEEEGAYEFLGPSWVDGHDSWPSGHTTIAYATATALHLEYRTPWVSVPAYLLATLGAWSRVNDDAHWTSDVFAGAFWGTSVAWGVYRARENRAGGQLTVVPGGVGMQWRF